MPSPATNAQQQQLAFPPDFAIELLIPAASDFDAKSYVREASSTKLTSRDTLFFEELLTVHVLVHGSVDDQALRALLARTEVTITANATSPAPPPRLQQPTGDAGIERPTKTTLDAVVLTGDLATVCTSSESRKCYAIFEATLYLRYPTIKLHKPLVHFSASAILNPPQLVTASSTSDSDYLSSTLPETENLLDSLVTSVSSRSSGGSKLALPASRLVKVAPRSSPDSDDVRPLRTASRLLPILPVLQVRVASATPSRMPEPMASLDIELTRYVTCCVEVQDVNVSAHHLQVQCLTDSLRSSLMLYPGDRSSLMYKFLQSSPQDNLGSVDQVLEVTVIATAQLTEKCRPRLKAQWHGGLGSLLNKNSRHSWQPPSISLHPTNDLVGSRPGSKHLSMTGRPVSMAGSDLGVTFAFTGPPSVNIGETFYIDTFIVNRSSRRKRLAIIAVPYSSKNSQTSTVGPRPFSAASDASGMSHGTAEAVVESKSIFGLQGNRRHHMAEVVCLNADVRVGPLPPGTCHNVQLEFLALSIGFVGLSAVHIVDLESKETTEVTDLPEIIVLDASTHPVHI